MVLEERLKTRGGNLLEEISRPNVEGQAWEASGGGPKLSRTRAAFGSGFQMWSEEEAALVRGQTRLGPFKCECRPVAGKAQGKGEGTLTVRKWP